MTDTRERARRRLIRHLLLVALIAPIFLLLPASSQAWHDGQYWFFRGYLPKSNGDRVVWHETCDHLSCPNLVLRIAFQCGSKQMDEMAMLKPDYSWALIIRLEPYQCDDYSAIHYEDMYKAGCRNPNIPPFILVWTNCRVGNGL